MNCLNIPSPLFGCLAEAVTWPGRILMVQKYPPHCLDPLSPGQLPQIIEKYYFSHLISVRSDFYFYSRCKTLTLAHPTGSKL